MFSYFILFFYVWWGLREMNGQKTEALSLDDFRDQISSYLQFLVFFVSYSMI